ncbi:hypothetical protein SLS62_001606 [Diatrype stigma]|uniref:RNase H type-1 domain-containing protein n=1 Tax=Diatrype stigma TaxID=117547 RepID=A0AAN9YWG1_9PEZI
MSRRILQGWAPIFGGSIRRTSPGFTRSAAQDVRVRPFERLQHSAAHTQKQVDAVMLGLASLKQKDTHNKQTTAKNTPKPQVALPGRARDNSPTPRFCIEEQEIAKSFALRAVQPGSDLGDRLVLYTDATYLPARNMGGMAVVYKHFLGDSVPAWTDKAHAAVFLGSHNKAEALAIRDALEIALVEIRTYYGVGGEKGPRTSKLPRVMIFTDSQGALQALRNYLLSGTIKQVWDGLKGTAVPTVWLGTQPMPSNALRQAIQLEPSR